MAHLPFRTLIAVLHVIVSFTSALYTKQQVLEEESSSSILTVVHELKKAEIIPTVIDDFLPSLTLSVSWSSDKTADLGNTIKPSKLQDKPRVKLHDDPTSSPSPHSLKSNMTYTVILTDPDAPSRDNPEWSEMCHWILAGVPFSSADDDHEDPQVSPTQVVEWKPPGPPPKTGKHRYVFLAFAPKNGTSAPLDLSKPADRQHWGTGKERHGVRQWASDNELVPVAANFIYSQNKKQ